MSFFRVNYHITRFFCVCLISVFNCLYWFVFDFFWNKNFCSRLFSHKNSKLNLIEIFLQRKVIFKSWKSQENHIKVCLVLWYKFIRNNQKTVHVNYIASFNNKACFKYDLGKKPSLDKLTQWIYKYFKYFYGTRVS